MIRKSVPLIGEASVAMTTSSFGRADIGDIDRLDEIGCLAKGL
jgi:hypothetical protein